MVSVGAPTTLLNSGHLIGKISLGFPFGLLLATGISDSLKWDIGKKNIGRRERYRQKKRKIDTPQNNPNNLRKSD